MVILACDSLHFGHQNFYDPLFFFPKIYDPQYIWDPPSEENASPLNSRDLRISFERDTEGRARQGWDIYLLYFYLEARNGTKNMKKISAVAAPRGHGGIFPPKIFPCFIPPPQKKKMMQEMPLDWKTYTEPWIDMENMIKTLMAMIWRWWRPWW